MTRRLTIIRWFFYGVVTLLALLLQSQLLPRITLWGVCPIVIPCIAAIAGTQEHAPHAAIFAIVLGAVCDTLFAAGIPCFFVVVCLLSVLLAHLISRHLVLPGFRCSLASCAAALLLSGAVSGAVSLWNGAQFGTVAYLILRETIVSLPFALLLAHPALRYVNRITTP